MPRDSIAATSSDLANASWWLAHPSASQTLPIQATCNCTEYDLQVHSRCNGSSIMPEGVRWRSCCTMPLGQPACEVSTRNDTGSPPGCWCGGKFHNESSTVLRSRRWSVCIALTVLTHAATGRGAARFPGNSAPGAAASKMLGLPARRSAAACRLGPPTPANRVQHEGLLPSVT